MYEVFPTVEAMGAMSEWLVIGVVLGLGLNVSVWMLGYIIWFVINMIKGV